jgi:molecular chaperone GrpE
MSKKDKNKATATAEKPKNKENKAEKTIEILEDKNQVLQEELEKEKERNLRLFAEFENYKKRTTKERLDLFKSAGQDVIQSLVPVLDDFDRALIELKKSEDDTLYKGVLLIHNKFKETLKIKGLSPLEVKQGDAFDADIHEAITQIPAPSEELKGKIIDVVEKGYQLGDKILRYPKVVIGQ